jgi:cobalt/nickel transport system permease protein
MWAVSGGCIAGAAARLKKDELCEKKLPLMAVCGAFVFAAQMMNFTIPGTGSSGHICGGILLSALLGGGPAVLTITAVLTIQCLIFADGGLLALGCNIFNMGILPCLVMYPLLFRPLMKKGITPKRLTLAAVLCSVLGLQLGAFSVVVETQLSGITALPFGTFLLLMQPIHLAIGFVEGLATSAVLVFVAKMRPELLESAQTQTAIGRAVPLKRVLLVLGALAVLTAGGLSLLASQNPDGLEWALQGITGSTELAPQQDAAHAAAQNVQNATALLPDYAFSDGSGAGAAGVLGAAATFALAGACGLGISHIRRKHAQKDVNTHDGFSQQNL